MPVIMTGKIAEGIVTINVRPFCHPDNGTNVVSEVNENIKVAFEKNKIKPALQSRIIHNINA